MKWLLRLCGLLILALCFTQQAQSQNDRFLCETQINSDNDWQGGDAAIAFSHDGSMLIQHRQEDCCFANFVSVWKVPTCELIWEWRNTSSTRFFSVAFSPTNKNIIAFGTARRVYVFDIDTNTEIKEIRDGGADFLWFTDDHLITIRDYHGPRPVKIYDIATWDLVREFSVADQISGGFKMHLRGADLSPDAKIMTLGFTPNTNTDLGEGLFQS